MFSALPLKSRHRQPALACPFGAKPGHRHFIRSPVGAQQERQGDIDVERFCGFLIDQELDALSLV
jgi:hypothetical protein